MIRSARDDQFLRMCLMLAEKSPDPNTRVGSMIVSAKGDPICGGFNRLPTGIKPNPERLKDRDTKLSLILHAEQAAIAIAAARGASTMGCTLYTACTDDSGAIWGGPPCASRCLPIVLEAGFALIVSYPFKAGASKWAAEVARSHELLAEAGVTYREVPLP